MLPSLIIESRDADSCVEAFQKVNSNPIAFNSTTTYTAKDQPPTVAGFNLRGATPEIPLLKTDVTFKQPPSRRTHTYSLSSVHVILGLVVLPLLSQTS